MKRPFLLHSLLLMVVLFWRLPNGFAQLGTAQVKGTVTDPTGAVVPAATVRLTDKATNVESQVLTNQSGYFTFVGLKPGTYGLRVEMQGFRRAEIPPFDVGVNQAVTQDVTLSLGDVTQTVEVTAQAALIQQSSAELGAVVPEKAVSALPLNGRNFTQLLTLAPGATPVSVAQGAHIGNWDGDSTGIPGSAFSNPSLNGQWNRAAVYYLDGIINTDFRVSTYAILPNVDLVQEFKVQTHNDKVEYGGVTGGVVNLVSRSGGNAFHGSAFEFLRNNTLDARNPFTDATEKHPAPFRQNQFGAALGGRIIRDKLFFYGGYDGWRYRKPSQSMRRVPTDAELSGDFSASTWWDYDIYNPFSTRLDAGQYVRDPFMCDASGNPITPNADGTQTGGTPCRKIPSSLISPMTQGLFQTYQEKPNYTDPTGQNNFMIKTSTKNNSDNWQIKVDYNMRQSDSMFFRWSEMRWNVITPSGELSSSTAPATGRNYGGGWIHVFRPTLLLDVRGGYSDRHFTSTTEHVAGLEALKALGFADVDRFEGAYLSLSGGPWSGAGIGGPAARGNPTWNISTNLNWIRGNHTLKTGFQWINFERLQVNKGQTYNFYQTVTDNPQAPGSAGSGLASALLGLPSVFQGTLPEEGKVNFTMGTWSAYFQDEWKVSPNVTVNYGIRLDHTTRPTMHQIGLQAGEDLDRGVYLIGAATMPPACNDAGKAPCIPGNGLEDVPYGDKIVLADNPVFLPQPSWDDWGPRVSVAWRVEPKTVVRAGYGLLWDAFSARTQYTQHNSEARWPSSSGFYGTANAIGDAPEFIADLQGVFPAVLPAASPWNRQGWTNDPDRKDAYSHQWNVEIQRQMTSNLMLAVAYVGSVNRRLEFSGLGNSARTPAPPGSTPEEINALRPQPFMGGGIFYSRSLADSNYNALQFKLDRRFANGLQTLLSYTWSKSIDTSSGWFAAEPYGIAQTQNYFDLKGSRGVSSYDIPHYLSWFTVYELPVGRGKRWLASGPASYILGNWQVNYIMQARAGEPYSLGVHGDVANIGNDIGWYDYARPNLVGDPKASSPTQSQYFNTAAFAVPQFAFGSFGRNVLRTDGVFNVDFSLFKTIPFSEKAGQLELRFEFFNLFNMMNWGAPGQYLGDSNFGKINSLASGTLPREIQFGIRYSF